ncbi:MFS transporter [Rhodococcus sp. IEGM1428]|uniref:MFS transporter n=1 Tax=Rhodococcus sp. IEGM1428 TaxID=3392191 RepID=UPI003D0DEF65
MSTDKLDSTPAQSISTSLPTQSQRRRVLAASFIGTTIEWYDFFIYGTAAALVLGPQFFPSASPLAGTLAAFATFSVGFLARPLGGIIMGHFGDRIGRKAMLVTSLMIMGVATVLVGVLPNYASIGLAAPILLVVLRLAQGIGVGGEWGGAVLMAVEYAPPARRSLYGSVPQMGVPAGIILSTIAYLAVGRFLTESAFESWGWRIPFLLSGVLIVVGLLIRLSIAESPEFTDVKRRGDVRRNPLKDVLTGHWRALVIGAAISVASTALGYLVLVYMLSYGTTQLDLPRELMLEMILTGAAVWLVGIPLFAVLADRIGRRPVFLGGAALAALWAVPFFVLVDSRSVPSMIAAFAVATAAVAAMAGPQAAVIADLFPPSLRYSGASIAYQAGSIVGGGVAPIVAAALLATTGTSMSIAVYMILAAAISLIAGGWIRSKTRIKHDA